ncbi:MAG: YesN/AraC family two-component response regulator [Myxococcota bacterium]|jgi:YesN/AraC family two-component response regulator
MISHGTQRLRVLVADDEIEIRELLGEYLSARGHEVQTASDGRQALSWLEHNPIDVLLTDVQMPNVTGVELVSALHSQSMPIGVVVMTGFPTIESATTAMKMGASDYLLKPFRLRDVYKAVARAAGWGRAERELVRLKQRLALIESLLVASRAEQATLLQAQLPALLSSRAEVGRCALWLRQGEDFVTVIPPTAGLVSVRPEAVVLTTLSSEGATIRLPGGAGVLAIEGSISAQDLERIEQLARILTAALGR